MNADVYIELKRALLKKGYGAEVAWAANIKRCDSADDFALEHAFVVCNSGMKAQIAGVIFDRVRERLRGGGFAAEVFGHVGKSAAIDGVWRLRRELFLSYLARETREDKIEFLATLPWIGNITRWHLAKNLGIDCCKPDRHLVRIAVVAGETPGTMCDRLARETGDRVALVDTVIWRAANLGFV